MSSTLTEISMVMAKVYHTGFEIHSKPVLEGGTLLGDRERKRAREKEREIQKGRMVYGLLSVPISQQQKTLQILGSLKS